MMREKVFGSNSVCPHGDYYRISIPNTVIEDDDFEVDLGTELKFVGRIDDDGKRIVLEIEEG